MRFLEAKDQKLADILFNNRFRIDSFQREYRWQRKHIEALISDLATNFDKYYQEGDTIETYADYGSYYMGPVVLYNDNKELSIVDGQQRLTSLTLLLIYLYHQVNDEDIKHEIKKHFYVRRGGKNTLILNVESRNDVIESLISHPEHPFKEMQELEDIPSDTRKLKDESIPNILARYEDITLLFPENLREQEVLLIFIEWLLNNVVLVEITAFSMESAYTIFETMNDRGMSLNPTEILKGYLLSMIEEEEKSEEMNEFWKERIFDLKALVGADTDVDFFRNWLRAKYAESRRSNVKGAENLDFEQIGTQFHSWVKNNSTRLYLKKSDDFYLFIKSDFDFYSILYMDLYKYRNYNNKDFNELYITNFYTIAESLAYPLFLAPLSKADDEVIIEAKIKLVNRFIDAYTVFRSIQGKSITQSSIRSYMYDLIRDIRNADLSILDETFKAKVNEIRESKEGDIFSNLQPMNNWGFYHYFYARLLYYLDSKEQDFMDLMRNRKQSSLILVPIFTADDFRNYEEEENFVSFHLNSVANYVLIKRYDADKFYRKSPSKRIEFLFKNNYIPECVDNKFEDFDKELSFIVSRDQILNSIVYKIWNSYF
ncbi:uncharacterized protein with ParB-like and HNH nuclease domain [Chryseobacterium defluvii]|uniref:Uncharacterized protein with ParB-like and HNH nuclease domain n=1 Tax=Chryseobacterium defluvii TaxID=160396 RepID=A0A840KE63_9FLAO|nr:DUF262 domain-containing protein [Chryseobacterium defluvii]MBB4805833.1 uncharacterized protein with ParB-like and HNH nuclease domain [Chryseobacterium defluvii]